MSTIFDHATGLRGLAGSDAVRIGHLIRRSWQTFQNWRIERAAIAQFSSMSDRELKDIGLDRSEIGFAVKGKLTHNHRAS